MLLSPSTPGEFALYFDLRWRVLRAPWDQPRGSERDALEAVSFHLMWRDAEDVPPLACGRLHLENDGRAARIRYMAVDPCRRGRGLGRAVLLGLEAEAARRGVQHLRLHARDEAVGFYAHHGYTADGPGPVLFGSIPHTVMHRLLPSPAPGSAHARL